MDLRSFGIYIATAMVFSLLYACKSTNEEDLYGCPTSNVSYKEDIEPIIEANCYNCHSDANAPTFTFGISLEGYDNLAALAADSSIMNYPKVLGNIERLNGFSAMPKGTGKLDDCDIEKIRSWIKAGRPNN